MKINYGKLEKALRRERKRKNNRKMVVDNKSIFLLEKLAEEDNKKFRKYRKQRIKEKENLDE